MEFYTLVVIMITIFILVPAYCVLLSASCYFGKYFAIRVVLMMSTSRSRYKKILKNKDERGYSLEERKKI